MMVVRDYEFKSYVLVGMLGAARCYNYVMAGILVDMGDGLYGSEYRLWEKSSRKELDIFAEKHWRIRTGRGGL